MTGSDGVERGEIWGGEGVRGHHHVHASPAVLAVSQYNGAGSHVAGVALQQRTADWRLGVRGKDNIMSAGTVSFAEIQRWHFVFMVRWPRVQWSVWRAVT